VFAHKLSSIGRPATLAINEYCLQPPESLIERVKPPW
jgi:hypothetical protein